MEQQVTFWGTVNDSKRSKQQESGANQTKQKNSRHSNMLVNTIIHVRILTTQARVLAGQYVHRKRTIFVIGKQPKNPTRIPLPPGTKNISISVVNVCPPGVEKRPHIWGHFPSLFLGSFSVPTVLFVKGKRKLTSKIGTENDTENKVAFPIHGKQKRLPKTRSFYRSTGRKNRTRKQGQLTTHGARFSDGLRRRMGGARFPHTLHAPRAPFCTGPGCFDFEFGRFLYRYWSPVATYHREQREGIEGERVGREFAAVPNGRGGKIIRGSN